MKLRKFIRGENFYFQILDEDGSVILESQAYTAKDARDNGIDSVKTNISKPERYSEVTEGGETFFILKAGNNQEIARSIGYTDGAALKKAKDYAQRSRSSSGSTSSSSSGSSTTKTTTTAASTTPAQPDGGEAYGTDGKGDDYKPLNFYVTNGSDLKDGFDSFAAAGESYFSYRVEGSVYMISEGYSSDSSRDNGINSVTKNMVEETRYQRMQHPNGKYFFNLKAGNHQEIATSAWFDSEGERDAAIAKLIGGSGSGSGSSSAGSTTAQGIASTTVAASTVSASTTESEAPKKKRKTGPKKPKTDKVYLADGKYHDTEITYQLFRSGNGKHYFTFRNAEEKTILLNSDVRGFETQEQGQAKIDRVLEFGPDRGNYESKTTKNDKFYYYLKDGDGNNIAKSFFFKTEEDMEVAINSLLLASGGSASTKGAGQDEYLVCSAYEAHMGSKSPDSDDFIIFSQEGEHYFAMVGEGKVILRSEGYTTDKARDNGIQSVLKNRELEERYSVVEEDGSHFLILKAGNHQEIGRGCPNGDHAGAMYWHPGEISKRAAAAAAALAAKKAEEEAAAMRKAEEEAAAKRKAEEEAAAKKKAEEEAAAKKKAEEEAASAAASAAAAAAAKAKAKSDDYLTCKIYESHIADVTKDHDDFITFSHEGEHYFAWIGEGKVVMRSEGYGSESARDNGIASVIKNRDLEERFSLDEKAGHYFTVLKAGNHQEIARSCPHKDKAAAMYWYPSAISSRAAAKAEEEKKAAAAAAAATAAAAVVTKKAARSDDYLACRVYESHMSDVSAEHKDFITFVHEDEHYFAWVNDGKIVMRSEGYSSDKARDNGIASVIKNRELEERFSIDEKAGHYFTVLKAGNHQEIARSCPHKEKSAAKAWFPGAAVAAAAVPLVAAVPKAAPPKPEPPKDKEDDYLACKHYEGRKVNDKENNVALFKHDGDGQYYFALYDEKGDVKLRSEGFRKAEERDQELSGVVRLHNDASMYKKMEKGNYYMDVLHDETGREVGRSCLKKVVVAAPVPVAPKDKEDDYLPCKEYEGRKVNDKQNNVALFKHDSDGQFYFALYDKDGDVKLRSEGFRTGKERDEELSGVLKYHNDESMYKRKEKGKYFMDILYDKTGREVGRSCLQKKVKKVAPVATAAVATAAAAVVAKKPEPKKVEAKKAVPAPVKKKVAAAPVKKAAAVAESGGGFKLWWLLPLLLIPLLWFLLRGCGGETPPPPPPVKVEAPAPKPAPVPEPVKATPPPPAPKPAPVAVAGCNCGEKGNIAIFTIPSGPAKSVARLGTYPEFGNSHSLSPAQFYQKLSDRHSTNQGDQQYLDYVFRSMGYSNGFAGASAGLFSNVTLDRGQKGLLGLGEQHHYEYSALNTNDRDRQAFKIKSANGCDVHFMKTCGNYMFFCD